MSITFTCILGISVVGGENIRTSHGDGECRYVFGIKGWSFLKIRVQYGGRFVDEVVPGGIEWHVYVREGSQDDFIG